MNPTASYWVRVKMCQAKKKLHHSPCPTDWHSFLKTDVPAFSRDRGTCLRYLIEDIFNTRKECRCLVCILWQHSVDKV